MRRGTLPILALGLLLLLGWLHPALAAKRVALVIGNDDYEHVSKLQKAVNDARALAETLEAIGFDVIRAENVTRREMNQKLQALGARLEPGDEALFFFAGHGVEIDGRNFLLPTDIPSAVPGQEDFVQAEAIPVDQVLDRLRARGTRISILVLDACRDNPFPTAGTRSLGLARMAAPQGSCEASAREVAEAAFGVTTRFPPGKGLTVPPWLRSELVRAEIIDSPLYSADGPTEVLQPTFSEAL